MSPVSLWSDWHFVASLKIIKNYRSQNPRLLYPFVALRVSDNFLFANRLGEEVQSLKTLCKLLLYCVSWETKDFGLQNCRKVTTLKITLGTFQVTVILNNLAWIAKHWIKIFFSCSRERKKLHKCYGTEGYSSLVDKIHFCSGISHVLIHLFSRKALTYRIWLVC